MTSVLDRLWMRAAIVLAAPCVATLPCDAGGGFAPFSNQANARGLIYQMPNYPHPYGYLGWGCGFADLDSDGDSDVIIIGAASKIVGIFENNGAGQFTNRSAGSGIPLLPSGSAFAAADYDADGDLDIYFTQVGENNGAGPAVLYPNVLMRNDGNFQFTDVTAAAGVGDLGASKGPCWGDFDNDGWVDLYVPNYNGIVNGTALMNNRLYRNLGDGTFVDVAAELEVDDNGYGFQAVWFDYDRDGDVDLYLSNDRGHQAPLFRGNQLWRNDGGTFVNVSDASGTGLHLFSMGVACGDFDGNGWADLYVTNIPPGGGYNNPLMLNQGDGTFIEWSMQAGVDNPWTSWGCIFFDFDNNGTHELYVNNQWTFNKFYVDIAGFPCGEFSEPLGIQGPVFPSKVSFCSAVADVDGDGDLELLENNVGEAVRLYINNEGHQQSWAKLHIVGVWPNTFAIGARVEATLPGRVLLREVLAGGNGYLGQNELDIHLGLDADTVIPSVLVSWPGGSPTRTLTNLPAGHTWTAYPPDRLGDAGGDGAVDLADFQVLAGCYGQAIEPGCEVMDFDGDSDIDGDDAAAFFDRFAGTVLDCDGDKQPDLLQILVNAAADANANGVLDACEAEGDVNGDGVVNVNDLVAVITAWGACGSPCFGDTNGDGTVSVDDLVTVLLNWS